jgi:hypothetical protein
MRRNIEGPFGSPSPSSDRRVYHAQKPRNLAVKEQLEDDPFSEIGKLGEEMVRDVKEYVPEQMEGIEPSQEPDLDEVYKNMANVGTEQMEGVENTAGATLNPLEEMEVDQTSQGTRNPDDVDSEGASQELDNSDYHTCKYKREQERLLKETEDYWSLEELKHMLNAQRTLLDLSPDGDESDTNTHQARK